MYSIKSLVGFFVLAMLFAILPATANSGAYAASLRKHLENSTPPDLWKGTDEARVERRGKRLLRPEKFRMFTLNRSELSKLMAEMPMEFADSPLAKNTVMDVPLPDGTLVRFRIEESPVLAPHLAADFPTWKTFFGVGVDDPTLTARFDWTAIGFHGYIFTGDGTVYIDPYQEKDNENYVVYYKHEYGTAGSSFSCGVEDSINSMLAPRVASPDTPAFAYGTNIRTYRLAIATTGEWARSTTASTDPQTIRTAALAAMTTSVNRLDAIYRRELAVTLQLVNPSISNNATNIIFDDPPTDPYDNTDSSNPPNDQLAINQTTIDARVGAGNYDVGHLYGTGGGGVAASPSVCSTSKAQGYSARAGFLGDPFTVDYVAHEIGHQFGGSHTYNTADNGGACTTRSVNNAFEVASGSTIMSYVGICNIRNLQQFVDPGTPMFHIRSLTQMVTNLQDTSAESGGSCGTVVAGTNSIPTVNPGPSFTIPRLTPFTLTATGNDADASDVPNLLYSWEEYDLAPSASGQVGVPALTYDVDTDGVLRPLFRAYSPVASPSRTFPNMTFILNPANNAPAGSNNPPLTYQGTHPTGAPGATCQAGNDCVIGENLPSVARTMNFRVAVRDNRGGIADAGMTVTVATGTGPFQVTSQNTAPATWPAGSTQTVTWDVAGTSAAPIGAANVKISLSTDGGLTFPTTLLASTPNDGTQPITVPNTLTTLARIKVEAVGNVFFDVNNTNFSITAAEPGIGIGDVRGTESGGTPINSLANSPANAPFNFTVARSGNLNTTSTVFYQTVDGTATVSDHDYEPVSGTLTFLPGESTKTITVIVDSDDHVEPDEAFFVHLSGAAGASITDADGEGDIINDDTAATTVQFGSATFVGDESQSAIVTITRSGDTSAASSVTFSTVPGGTATPGACGTGGADYSTVTQLVSFNANDTSKNVSIPLCSDLVADGNETVNLTLSNASAPTAEGNPGSAVLRINDTASQSVNTASIGLFAGGNANPFPSTINVTNGPALVGAMRVTLFGTRFDLAANVDVLLVGPTGKQMILMADTGGPVAMTTPATLTFVDSIGQVLPCGGPLVTGIYRPTNCTPGQSAFNAPAPAPNPGPFYNEPGTSTAIRQANQTLNGVFGGLPANGAWNIYIRDDAGSLFALTGEIANGWGIQFFNPTAASNLSLAGRVVTAQGQGIRNARVMISDASQSLPIAVQTSSFGYFDFEGLQAGRTYIVTVNAKRYTFRVPSRAVSLFDSLSDIDFVADP